MFNRLYKHYKNDFDTEMMLKKTDTTYSAAYNRAQKDEEWF